jgi:hypothetical protein
MALAGAAGTVASRSSDRMRASVKALDERRNEETSRGCEAYILGGTKSSKAINL